jgi:NhaP-type Na+/H+ or K+/H+ antiporter
MDSFLNVGPETDRTNNKRKPLNLYSFVSIAFMATLLTIVVLWHDQARNSNKYVSSHRSLTTTLDEDPSIIDDDNTRSGTCQRYLMNFLNGTTDASDECQAFYNAYRVADCADETHNDILGMSLSNSTTNDDVVIDDFFKNWECCDSIKAYYQTHCENSGLHSNQLLGVMVVLVFCTMIKAMLKSWNIHWIPDACAFILVGTFVGGMLRILDSGLVSKMTFDNDLFLQIMLPPIIFQAALSIDKKAFRRDLLPILLFAGIGTGFSSITIGWMVHYVSHLGTNGSNLPWLDSLVFGSLISSIDPVATLSILAGVGISQTDTLYTLIFGESLLNDGVAIVLFEVLKDHLGEDDSLGDDAYKEMSKHFAIVLFGSIAIGIGAGMCCTLYFWAFKEKQTAVTEVAIFFCWSLIPYYIADGLHCSGIIAIMVMGFVLDFFVVGGVKAESGWREVLQQEHENTTANQFQDNSVSGQLARVLKDAFSGKGHILDTSRHHVGFVAHVVAMIMETAIFAYLGLFLFVDNKWNLRLNLTAIMSCVSSRFVMVVILSFLVNLAVFFDFEKRIGRCLKNINPLQRVSLMEDDDHSQGDRVYLDRKTQLIMLLAGVRGAVSFALVENIPVWDNVSKTGSQFKSELKTMTSSSIVFTLFVFGALTYMAVKSGTESESDRARAMLTNRLLREQQANGEEPENELSLMEVDGQRISNGQNSGITPQDDLNNMQDARYLSSNEWIS